MMNEELQYFVENVLPPLAANEVYFLSASARNKYLTKAQREYYDLGRTEMFAKRVVRDQDRFVEKVQQLEEQLHTYKTRNANPMPKQCTILYVNCNPSNTVKAYTNLQADSNQKIYEAITNPNSNAASDYFKRIDQQLLKEIQKATGTKHYIDVDFDVDGSEPAELFHEVLTHKGVEHYTIQTKSGYHVLLKRDTITYNYTDTVKKLNETFCSDSEAEPGEIVINNNNMIPIPGTYQAGHFVKIIHRLSHSQNHKEEPNNE